MRHNSNAFEYAVRRRTDCTAKLIRAFLAAIKEAEAAGLQEEF